MNELLTKPQKAALAGILGKCNSCRQDLDMLKALGEDTSIPEEQVLHLTKIAEQSLALNEQISGIR